MAKKSKHNPRGDDDVERGYQEHQKKHRKKPKPKPKPKPKKKVDVEPFEVDPTGSSIRGPKKDEH